MDGPFRINAPAMAGDARAVAPGAPAPLRPARQAPGDEYLQRLIKLVPSEVLALYVTFKEIADISGTSLNTVAARYRYALAKLRTVLEA